MSDDEKDAFIEVLNERNVLKAEVERLRTRVAELAAGIADDSVDLIFTDPPYDEESVTLYRPRIRPRWPKTKGGER